GEDEQHERRGDYDPTERRPDAWTSLLRSWARQRARTRGHPELRFDPRCRDARRQLSVADHERLWLAPGMAAARATDGASCRAGQILLGGEENDGGKPGGRRHPRGPT